MVHEKPKVIPGWRPSAVTCLHTFHQLIRVIRQIPGLRFPWIYVCGKLEVLIPASSTRAGSRGRLAMRDCSERERSSSDLQDRMAGMPVGFFWRGSYPEKPLWVTRII